MASIIIPGTADATQLTENLWMGSAPPTGASVSNVFDCLVLCAAEYQPDPTCFKGVITKNVPLNDGPPMTQDEIDLSINAANSVIKWLKENKPVLVTCYAGLNRSGLVCALALCMLGMKSTQAISLVRRARGPLALSNPYFVRLINQFGATLV